MVFEEPQCLIGYHWRVESGAGGAERQGAQVSGEADTGDHG